MEILETGFLLALGFVIGGFACLLIYIAAVAAFTFVYFGCKSLRRKFNN